MSPSDFKGLKKLADACRKAGIKSFKNAEMEFTLSDTTPVSNYKKRQTKATQSTLNEYASMPKSEDAISDDALLFWSAADLQTTEESQ